MLNLGPKAKMWVAAIGGTVAALNTFAMVVQSYSADGAFSVEEATGTIVAVLTLVSTVYGVWWVKNER